MTNKNELSIEVTQAMRDELKTASDIIYEAQRSAEGLAERIAGQLYLINKKELYKCDDYEKMTDFAMDRYGIAKGTVSDSINTYERFGDKVNIGKIADKYTDYKFSTLMRIKKLTDEQIEAYGITANMSRADAIRAIEKAAEIEDKKKEAEQIKKHISDLTLAIGAYLNKDIVIECIEALKNEICGNKFVEVDLMTLDELRKFESRLSEQLKVVSEQNTESVAAESVEAVKAIIDTTFTEIEEQSSTVEPEAVQHTMPVMSINLNDTKYRKKDGKLNSTTVIADIKAILANIENHEYDLVVTCTE